MKHSLKILTWFLILICGISIPISGYAADNLFVLAEGHFVPVKPYVEGQIEKAEGTEPEKIESGLIQGNPLSRIVHELEQTEKIVLSQEEKFKVKELVEELTSFILSSEGEFIENSFETMGISNSTKESVLRQTWTDKLQINQIKQNKDTGPESLKYLRDWIFDWLKNNWDWMRSGWNSVRDKSQERTFDPVKVNQHVDFYKNVIRLEQQQQQNQANYSEAVNPVQISDKLYATYLFMNPPKDMHPFLQLLFYTRFLKKENVRDLYSVEEKIELLNRLVKERRGIFRYNHKPMSCISLLLGQMGIHQFAETASLQS